jgi:hypothetical protein
MIDIQLPPINLLNLRPAYMMTTQVLTETTPVQKPQVLDERVKPCEHECRYPANCTSPHCTPPNAKPLNE